MKVVIDIPEELIIHCKNRNMPVDCEMFARKIIEDIANGKILPKRHGRLIDADALFDKFEEVGWYNNADRDEVAEKILLDAPTIIEADKKGAE